MNKKYLFMALLIMAVGFAAVSTTLYLSGNAKIGSNDADFHVYYSDAYVNGVQDKSVIKSDTEIEFKTQISSFADSYVLDYDVTNGSKNYDADLEMVCTGGNEYLSVTNEFDDETILPALDVRRGKLTLKLSKSYVGEDVDISIKCTIKANAVERDILAEKGTPALFDEDDNVLKTWEELLDEGKVTVEGSSLTKVASDINGYRLLVPDTIESVAEDAWINSVTVLEFSSSLSTLERSSIAGMSTLERVIIPSKLDLIANEAFYNPYIIIDYNGETYDLRLLPSGEGFTWDEQEENARRFNSLPEVVLTCDYTQEEDPDMYNQCLFYDGAFNWT